MSEISPGELSVQKAHTILSHLGLEMKDLAGKKVLDVGSGENDLANAINLLGVPATIISVDIEKNASWLGLDGKAKTASVQADAESLPFADNSFDRVLVHGSLYPSHMVDSVRVLKPGGEIRIYPIGDQILQEYWYTMYYLEHYMGKSQEEALAFIQMVDETFRDHNGAVPQEYVSLREEALDRLTAEEKCGLIDLMVERYRQETGLDFQYFIHDPHAREPQGVILFTKSE